MTASSTFPPCADERPVRGIISDFDVLRAGMHGDGANTAAELARQPIIELETAAPLREAAELMLGKLASHWRDRSEALRMWPIWRRRRSAGISGVRSK